MDANQPLPQFRKDLQLFRGPDDTDGSPTFNLYDPIKGQYYKIGWAEASIIQMAKPNMSTDELIAKIKDETTITITAETLQRFYVESAKAGLLDIHRESGHILEEYEKSRLGIIKSILLYYLFFRIPLANPDRFLTKTYPYVKPLLSPPALLIYIATALWGLIIVATHWDEFFHTFTYFFNLQGAIAYALGIVAVKVIHESAHAYTAMVSPSSSMLKVKGPP